MVEQIIVKNDYERQALELLKRQTYANAKRFETRFLIMTGLMQDMNQAFTAVGWENFAVEETRFATLDHGIPHVSYR